MRSVVVGRGLGCSLFSFPDALLAALPQPDHLTAVLSSAASPPAALENGLDEKDPTEMLSRECEGLLLDTLLGGCLGIIGAAGNSSTGSFTGTAVVLPFNA